VRPDLAGAGSGQTGSAGVYKAGQRESGAVKAVGQEGKSSSSSSGREQRGIEWKQSTGRVVRRTL